MVRALFAVAAALQPAVIFIDEIDSVLSARKAEGSLFAGEFQLLMLVAQNWTNAILQPLTWATRMIFLQFATPCI